MNINILYPGHQCHNWLPVQWVSYRPVLLRNQMRYFSKHKLHAVCKMSVSRSVRLICISHQKQHTEMHINTCSHAIVVPSSALLGACDMHAVFLSQLQQTSIWSCERNSHFVTTDLAAEQHCTEKSSVLLGFGGFAQKTNHAVDHPQRAELTANWFCDTLTDLLDYHW